MLDTQPQINPLLLSRDATYFLEFVTKPNRFLFPALRCPDIIRVILWTIIQQVLILIALALQR